MTPTTNYDATRSVRRAAGAVAGLGLGFILFALVFAKPALGENPFYLFVSIPFAVLMIVVGLMAYAYAPKLEPRRYATDAEKAEADRARAKLQATLVRVLQAFGVISVVMMLAGAVLWLIAF